MPTEEDKDFVQAWLNLEEWGRRIASDRAVPPDQENDLMWFTYIKEAALDMTNKFLEFNEPSWADMALNLKEAANLSWLKASECLDLNKPKASCYFLSNFAFYELNDYFTKVTGKPCTWLLPEPVPSEEMYTTLKAGGQIAPLDLDKKVSPPKTYSLSMAENDLTACFHRMIEHFQDLLKEYRTEKRCMWSSDADPLLVEGCRKWNEASDFMRHRDLYVGEDYDKTKGRITGREAHMTVGSSPGHVVHANIEKGSLQYFDKDIGVNYVMESLLNSAGLDCQIWKLSREMEGGVICKGLNESNAKEAMKMLSAATSMDYRLARPKEYWTLKGDRGYRYPEIADTFGNCVDAWADPAGEGRGMSHDKLKYEVEKCALKETLKKV